MLKKNSLSPVAAGVLTLCFSFSAQTQARELPLPSFPASFEVAEYQGQKGCIPDDTKFKFAVMENEGMVIAGMHPLIDTAKTGVHTMHFNDNPRKHYGYTMSFRDDGKQCIYNKIENVRFGNNVQNSLYEDIKHEVTANDCNFDVMVINICGSFKSVTTRLTNAGYKFDWSGHLSPQHSLTLLTKDEQSFYLKTDRKTGATIITGVGKGAYQAYEVK